MQSLMHSLDTGELLAPWHPGVFSLLIFSAMVMILILAVLLLSRWLGRSLPGEEKQRAYESGIIPTGQARLRRPVPFFRVAIFFLLFDIEGAFLFAWAVANDPLGWTGWLQIGFFILILLAGLVYIWVKGGLEWGGGHEETS